VLPGTLTVGTPVVGTLGAGSDRFSTGSGTDAAGFGAGSTAGAGALTSSTGREGAALFGFASGGSGVGW
jgi:hypothetical protein